MDNPPPKIVQGYKFNVSNILLNLTWHISALILASIFHLFSELFNVCAVTTYCIVCIVWLAAYTALLMVIVLCLLQIFFPDLIDKTKTPEYSVIPIEDDKDFSILKFSAGPPYEVSTSTHSYHLNPTLYCVPFSYVIFTMLSGSSVFSDILSLPYFQHYWA